MPGKATWKDDPLAEGFDPIVRNRTAVNFPSVDFTKLSVVENGGPLKTWTDHSVLLTVKRLIVIVPEEDVDEAQLSRQIWNLAANYRLDVLLISVVSSADESLAARRRLTTIAAMIRAKQFKVEKQVVSSHRWEKALRPFWRQTDMVLCPAERTVKNLFQRTIPLSQVLSDHLKTPVYTFGGLYQPSNRKRSPWLRELPFWVGFLIILSIFFYFEANVGQSVHGWVGQTLLVVVMLIEIGFIYVWNLIAGKIK